jgi:hypothetical protein
MCGYTGTVVCLATLQRCVNGSSLGYYAMNVCLWATDC